MLSCWNELSKKPCPYLCNIYACCLFIWVCLLWLSIIILSVTFLLQALGSHNLCCWTMVCTGLWILQLSPTMQLSGRWGFYYFLVCVWIWSYMWWWIGDVFLLFVWIISEWQKVDYYQVPNLSLKKFGRKEVSGFNLYSEWHEFANWVTFYGFLKELWGGTRHWCLQMPRR